MENKKYEQKPDTGTIWMDLQTKTGVNGDYEVYSGNALVGGKDFYINGYPKTLPSGKQILSLTFKPKLPKAEAPRNEFASEPMPVMNGLAQFAEEKPRADEIPLESIPF